jgi:hypothetical protein
LWVFTLLVLVGDFIVVLTLFVGLFGCETLGLVTELLKELEIGSLLLKVDKV